MSTLFIGTHPWTSMKRISGLVQMYSTVGDRVPICLRRMLLKICATSFLPCDSHGIETHSANDQRGSYLKVDAGQVVDEQHEQPRVVQLLRELRDDDVRLWLAVRRAVQHVLDQQQVLAHVLLGLQTLVPISLLGGNQVLPVPFQASCLLSPGTSRPPSGPSPPRQGTSGIFRTKASLSFLR